MVYSVNQKSSLSEMHKNTFGLCYAEDSSLCTWSCFTDWQMAQLLIFIPFCNTNNPVMERELGLKQGLECLAVSLYYCWLLRCRQSVIIDCEIQSLIKVFTGLGRSPQ